MRSWICACSILILLLSGCKPVPEATATAVTAVPAEPPSMPTPAAKAQPAASLPPGAGPDGEALTIYEGPIEHIFFHPLIAYPELSFDGDSLSKGYNDWFVTVPEFKHILEDLYKNRYMLVDIRTIYEKKPLLLPKGQKPLVLSIDDLNYYDYMIRNGNVYKLILNETGQIVTESFGRNGQEVISDDNEIIPILDRFVERHPDFSDHGAKGIIALTGYEGILGYRTNATQGTKALQEQKDAAPVIKRLKETGWSFASHGWGHLDASKVSGDRLAKDTERWKREVEPLIGATPVYIYPYGSRVETDSGKFRALQKEGFSVFCSIGPVPYLQWQSGAMLMDRRHIDGMALQTQRSKLLDLFDGKDVLDPIRVKLMKNGK